MIIMVVIAMPLSSFSVRVNAQETFTISEFTISTETIHPGNITSGPDGNLWFTEHDGGKVGRISPKGKIREFTPHTNNDDTFDITAGPDGNLWFTENSANRIGRITPQGIITEFPLPSSGAGPLGITAGPNGNLWFTNGWDKILRMTPNGTLSEFSVPTTDSGSFDITTGPDGNLWFTESAGVKIGRITPNGTITEFPLPDSLVGNPSYITAGPDGNLWFTGINSNKIGRITPDGIITGFSTPSPDGGTVAITVGPDNNIWFTEYNGNRIGRITSDGTITEFEIPTLNSTPYGIAAGPDGNIWFTEYSANKIGRVNLSNLPPPTSERQVMFVHGINGNVKDIQMCNGGEGFQTLLCDPSIHPNVHYFTYYQDLGYKIKGDGCEPQPTPDTNTESLYPHPESISPDICDSQSAIAYNATKLDHDLLESSSPTAIIAHSMGATITRGWLTLAQSKQDDPTLNIVDTVMTIQGAHQGSYIPLGALPILKSFSWASPLWAAVITSTEQLIGFYKDRPAEADLTPKSKWYESANLTNVPPKMNYFNFYSDIQISARPQIFFVTLPRLGSVSFGDIVLLPGDPNPKKLPVFGGARFLPPGGSPANRHEFLLAKNYDVLLGSDILDFSFTDQLLGVAQNVAADPITHLNLFNHLTDTAIPLDSCKSPNVQTTIQNEILRILQDPKDACDRQGGLR